MVILPFGTTALLLEFSRLDEVLAMRGRLAASPVPGVVEMVPAARTLLLSFDPRVTSAARVRGILRALPEEVPSPSVQTSVIELDIVYDGADLADTAAALGISPEALAARHRDAEWTVAFTGFAPGFGYLVSDDWPYEVPRLASPRTRVPAGAVGVAGEFSGVYPRESPGGWPLIGTSTTALFDPDAAATLIAPGDRVRFVPAAKKRAQTFPTTATPSPSESTPGIRIIESGLLSTVQDLGRPGRAHLGVAPSGAFDREALRVANRILGNTEDAAAIEVTMGGWRAVAERDCWFAVTGAWGPILRDGVAVDPYTAHPWRAGTELCLEWFARGARAYLAMRGGVLAREVMGSRSTDTLAAIGPAPLAAGDRLSLGEEPPGGIPGLDVALWGAPADGVLDLELAPGPRADWFSPEASGTLFAATWTVSNEANRVGIRLDGPELGRIREGELPSEAMLPGAVQVPGSGRPVILGVDGPVTGGYPVIATLTPRSLDAAAQARPGTRLRFRHARTPS